MGILTPICKLSLTALYWSVTACLALTIPMTYCPPAVGQNADGCEVDQGDVKSLLDQGLYSFEEGDFNNAVVACEKAFALNPTNDAILHFVERAWLLKIGESIDSQFLRHRSR